MIVAETYGIRNVCRDCGAGRSQDCTEECLRDQRPANTVEQWRPIPGEPNYEASDRGQIRRAVGGKGCRAGRVLKPMKHSGGYREVSLWTDGKIRRRTVHTLVYEAFVGPRPDGLEVNHLDGDKTNNALANLQGATRAENQQHASATGLAAKGTRHPNYRITPVIQTQIRAAVERGRSYAAIARELGVSKSTVGNVVHRLGRFGDLA